MYAIHHSWNQVVWSWRCVECVTNVLTSCASAAVPFRCIRLAIILIGTYYIHFTYFDRIREVQVIGLSAGDHFFLLALLVICDIFRLQLNLDVTGQAI